MTILVWLANVASAQVACGNTITVDTTLTADLTCTPGFNGTVLTVGADGVVIDGGGFTITAPDAAIGIENVGFDNVVLQNVTLALGATSIGVDLRNTVGQSLSHVTASGLENGVKASVSNTGLSIIDSDVSSSVEIGMLLRGVDNGLSLVRNVFDNSTEGLRIDDLTGPWSLPNTAGTENSFAGVATGSSTEDVIYLEDVADITLDGLDLSSNSSLGRSIYMTRCDDITISNNDLSGRFRGVTTGGTGNSGLVITGNDVSDSAEFAMMLLEMELPLTIESNLFDRSDQGIRIDDLTGPWVFPTTNSFVDVPFNNLNDDLIELHDVTNISVSGLSLPSGTGEGNALRLVRSDGVTVDGVDFSGRYRGVITGTTADNLTVTNSDLSDMSLRALQLNGVDGNLVVTNNTLDGSANGVRLANTTAPVTLDMSTNTVVGVGGTNTREVVEVFGSTGVTVTDLEAYDLAGFTRVVRVFQSTDTLVDGITTCGAYRGVDVDLSSGTTVVDGQFGNGNDGVFINGTSTSTDVTADFLGNTGDDVDDNGTGTTVTAGVLADTDLDTIADVCDDCPDDALNDLDGDGLCADVDLDDDGDGVADLDDDDPNDPFVCDDTDNDSCDDCSVAQMLEPNNDGPDNDGDGACDAGDPDDDNDNRDDVDDSAPFDPNVCADTDYDGCEDCQSGLFDPSDDGTDTDGDGICDPKDLVVNGAVDFDTDDVPWTPGGIGSPSVVYDDASSLFVMVFETQTGTHPNCPVGTWALGLATSPNGLDWTDAGGALSEPDPDVQTPDNCVKAHPNAINRSSGNIVIFFKGEQSDDNCDVTTPSWGCNQYTGVGRMALTWNAGTSEYLATPPDSTPALNVGVNFGYIRGLFADAEYKVALTQKPDMVVASGAASSLTLDATVWSPGDAPWTPDEVYNPATVCEDGGGFGVFLGGRDLGAAEVVDEGNVGRLSSTDFLSWSIGPGPIFSTSVGDNELRHWDVLRVGTTDYLLYFSDQTGPGGSNRVGLAETNTGWSIANVQSKVCP